MKDIITKLLKKNTSLKQNQIQNLIEIPPNPNLGDYSFPCFVLSKKLKKSPNQIAENLRKKIKLPKQIEQIQALGPYLNFFIDKKFLAEKVVKDILKQKNNYGKTNLLNKKKIMVEFPSPNTNKPLHLGHLRNMSIGESVSRLLEFNNAKIIRANLNNDRGIHISKSMLAYQKFGKNKKPGKIKSDHFVGDFYVLFNEKAKNNKVFETQAQELLQKWEKGDKKTIALWKKMNKWALNGFEKTYKKFDIKLDKNYYESEMYKKGKQILLNGVKKRLFKKRKDGAIIINLGKELGEKVLLRANGTAVYITQDLYLAKLKFKSSLDYSIYITGNEQDYHFSVLFKIIKKLGWKFSDKLKHLSYGMVFLPQGKMKSREGIVVDADDIIEKTQNLVKKELRKREKLSKPQNSLEERNFGSRKSRNYKDFLGKELESRSLKIALAAIKYFLLKIDVKKNMVFNPQESINFEGDTGPYLQYSYARASSILRKSKPKNKFKIKELNSEEIELIKKLSQFSEVVEKSHKNLNPSHIANYSYQLAKTFNEFYHKCPVIKSEQKDFRLALVQAFRNVLKNSLDLLGIDVLERM